MIADCALNSVVDQTKIEPRPYQSRIVNKAVSMFLGNYRNGAEAIEPAARSVLSTYLRRTEWVLAGVSRAEMAERTKAAVATHKIQPPEVGSMVYMMSKQGYLCDDAGGPWYPHLMFFVSGDAAKSWGANLSGSPVIAANDPEEGVTIFMIWVGTWSDGTPAPPLNAR